MINKDKKWKECDAIPGDTVKILWSKWLRRSPDIGVVLSSSPNSIIIDVGDRLVYLGYQSTILVYKTN